LLILIDEMGRFKISLSWEQEVAIIMINFLKDVDIVKYFLSYLKGDILEINREFHCSLRKGMKERWNEIDDSFKGNDFHKMEASVPITFDIPFNGEEWKNSTLTMELINFLRPGFISLKSSEFYDNYITTSPLEDFSIGVRSGEDIQEYEDIKLHLKEKKKVIDKIYSLYGGKYYKIILDSFKKFTSYEDKCETKDGVFLVENLGEVLYTIPYLAYNIDTLQFSPEYMFED